MEGFTEWEVLVGIGFGVLVVGIALFVSWTIYSLFELTMMAAKTRRAEAGRIRVDRRD